MSMLHVGARCTLCHTVDFLPFTCPSCQSTFCQQHIQSHPCHGSTGESSTSSRPLGTLKTVGEGRCMRQGCDKPSIEALGGLNETERVGEDLESIARAVKCQACGGAFCTEHRQQAAHSCPGPRDHTARQDAAVQRKANAQDVLAKHFPRHANKTFAKPTAKDDTRTRPVSPPRLPPSVQAAIGGPTAPTENNSTSSGTSAGVGTESKKTKTKSEKLYEMHVRKLRSLAKPLDPKARLGDAEKRRFFEWTVDLERKGVQSWKQSGKYEGKLERAWIGSDIPVGRMLDLMIAQGKVSRPAGKEPSDALNLISLTALSDADRSITSLDLSKPAECIPEGALILLIKGSL